MQIDDIGVWWSTEWITRQVAAAHSFIPTLAKSCYHEHPVQAMEETLDITPDAALYYSWLPFDFWDGG